MSQVEVSTRFSISSYKPLCSPDGQFIVSVHNSTRLIIRSAETLERIRSLDLTTRPFAKITQILWEPHGEHKSTKFAVLVDSEAVIRIFDVLDQEFIVEIKEDQIFGIEKFQWLKSGKQLVVFSKDQLYVRVYHVLGKKILEFDKPMVTSVIERKHSPLYELFKEESNGNVTVYTLLNEGETSKVVYKVNLGSFVNFAQVGISPLSNWIIVNDSTLGEINLKVYSTAGAIRSNNSDGALFKYNSKLDPLGAIEFMFANDDEVLLSDHNETIHKLKISDGFKIVYRYEVRGKVDTHLTDICRESTDRTRINKSDDKEIPHIEGLRLEEKGVSKFLFNGSFLFVLVKSMPTSVFIYDLGIDEPKTVIICESLVKEIQTVEGSPGVLLVLTDNSVIVWKDDVFPPISVNKISQPNIPLRTLQIINSSEDFINLLVSDSDKSFVIAQVRLSLSANSAFQKMSNMDIEQLRKGSPALTNDISRAVQLAAGVQQSEWGSNTSRTLQVEDTFLTKKKPRH